MRECFFESKKILDVPFKKLEINQAITQFKYLINE